MDSNLVLVGDAGGVRIGLLLTELAEVIRAPDFPDDDGIPYRGSKIRVVELDTLLGSGPIAQSKPRILVLRRSRDIGLMIGSVEGIVRMETREESDWMDLRPSWNPGGLVAGAFRTASGPVFLLDAPALAELAASSGGCDDGPEKR